MQSDIRHGNALFRHRLRRPSLDSQREHFKNNKSRAPPSAERVKIMISL